jgi:hypothetical protein
MTQPGFTYRHRDAKVGLLAPLRVLPEFIYPDAETCRAFMADNLRDPQDFVILEGSWSADTADATGRVDFVATAHRPFRVEGL